MDELEKLFSHFSDAFRQPRTYQVAKGLAYGALTCVGRHTITGMLSASGKQFIDWSSAYRLFSQERMDTSKLFDIVCSGALQEFDHRKNIVAHMDDTILKKAGRHVVGASWRRDPLGPPFQTNFIWGQRFLQISMAMPEQDGCARSRAIPIDFHHCPTAKRPGKIAGKDQWLHYKEQKKITKLSKQGSLRIKRLRKKLDQFNNAEKQLLLSVDGSYTNSEVLKNLPERVTLIGRTRKDTKLYLIPDKRNCVGRNRVYGERLPTPEQIRQSNQYPWQEVKAWAAGKEHLFNVKVIRNVRWRSAGGKNDLQLVVIRPLSYRLTKKSKILYRQPAYLICTDPELDVKKLLQAYLWRWEIEVNFREEKTIFGCGQAQVRNPESVEKVPAFIVAMYALLHLASYKSERNTDQQVLPRPKWYQKQKNKRHSTGDIINNFRAQLWAKAIGLNFSSFVNYQTKLRSGRNKANPNTSAMFYVRN